VWDTRKGIDVVGDAIRQSELFGTGLDDATGRNHGPRGSVERAPVSSGQGHTQD
jgi:hypothetical protein